jgi:hypothetical protein
MALSGKYGKLDIPKIGATEPVFILRAQDMLAATVIQMYQLLASSHKRPLAAELDREVQAFRSWQGSKKMPD